MTVAPPPPPATPQATKRSGCWKWGVIGCAAALVITALGIGGIIVIVFGAIKSTDAYRGARLTAEKDPRVIAALGAPVHAGLWVAGSVNVNASGGEADIRFPLAGSRGRGVVHAIATRSGGSWHYSELTVRPRDGATIDLLTP
jgi:hypothetical protein